MGKMGWLRSTVVAGLLVLGVASPGLARVAEIEATAPLSDHGEPSVRAALAEAVSTAVRGAVAMGLRWYKISKAIVLEDQVAVKILATDSVSEPEGTVAPESGSDFETPPDESPGFLL